MSLFIRQKVLVYDKTSKRFIVLPYNETLDNTSNIALLFPFNIGIYQMELEYRQVLRSTKWRGEDVEFQILAQFRIGKRY